MQTKRFYLSVFFLVAAICGKSFAQDANSCEDYIMRHYRHNLVPASMSWQDKNFSDPYQEVTLRLKNVGEEALNGTGMRWMTLAIKGQVRKIQVAMPIASGQTIAVKVAVDPGLLRNCETTRVAIDLDHTVGQWGCMVWNDDSKDLIAQQSGGRLCGRLPITPIHFEAQDSEVN